MISSPRKRQNHTAPNEMPQRLARPQIVRRKSVCRPRVHESTDGCETSDSGHGGLVPVVLDDDKQKTEHDIAAGLGGDERLRLRLPGSGGGGGSGGRGPDTECEECLFRAGEA